MPFSGYGIYTAIVKIGKGDRPERPQGSEGKWFTDVIWGTLEYYWAPKRDERPSILDSVPGFGGSFEVLDATFSSSDSTTVSRVGHGLSLGTFKMNHNPYGIAEY